MKSSASWYYPILGERNQPCPKCPKYLCNISVKAWRMKLIFCFQKNTKVFLQDESLTLGLLIQSCPKCQKQQVYNIFAIPQKKKTWRVSFIFCMLINAGGFFKVILSFMVCVSSSTQIIQNNKLVISQS